MTIGCIEVSGIFEFCHCETRLNIDNTKQILGWVDKDFAIILSLVGLANESNLSHLPILNIEIPEHRNQLKIIILV